MANTSCKINSFLEREHTALEKGLMITGGLLAGLVIGLAIAPVTGGIEVSIGSHNGCDNQVEKHK